MSRPLALLRRSRTISAAVLAAVSALGVVAFVSATSSSGRPASLPAVPPPPAVPTRASQIQNIDQVRTAIKGYYGDTVTTEMDPVNGTVALHEPSATGNWRKEVAAISAQARHYLDTTAANWTSKAKPAIVLDVDDTSLVTYNYEIYSNFAYNPTTSGAFIDAGVFPAVYGMPAVVRRAIHDGYTVFWLTGRPGTQRQATLSNLSGVGYQDVVSKHLYLKDYDADGWLSSCAPACTTIQYKSLTRQHIQSRGYRIAANFGDQWSDLEGGFTLKNFKMPNPMYYLP